MIDDAAGEVRHVLVGEYVLAYCTMCNSQAAA
jgi:hypothetical protein